jgi:hypothetical protein
MTERTRIPPVLFRAAPRTGRRARIAAVVAIALAGALGCGGGDSTGPRGGTIGTYNIVSVTGPQGTDDSAPFVLINQTVDGQLLRAEIASGYITLGENGRYQSAATVNFFVNGNFAGNQTGFGGASSGNGTYSISGASVTLTPDATSDEPNPTPVTGTLNAGTITMTETVDEASLGHATFTIVLRK